MYKSRRAVGGWRRSAAAKAALEEGILAGGGTALLRASRKLEDLKLELSQFPDEKIAVGAGCDECFQSGFSGRTAIYELMPIDSTVQEQIVDKASASLIKRTAIQRGLRTLRMDGVEKLLEGQTTPEEILRVTQLDIA